MKMTDTYFQHGAQVKLLTDSTDYTRGLINISLLALIDTGGKILGKGSFGRCGVDYCSIHHSVEKSSFYYISAQSSDENGITQTIFLHCSGDCKFKVIDDDGNVEWQCLKNIQKGDKVETYHGRSDVLIAQPSIHLFSPASIELSITESTKEIYVEDFLIQI